MESIQKEELEDKLNSPRIQLNNGEPQFERGDDFENIEHPEAIHDGNVESKADAKKKKKKKKKKHELELDSKADEDQHLKSQQ